MTRLLYLCVGFAAAVGCDQSSSTPGPVAPSRPVAVTHLTVFTDPSSTALAVARSPDAQQLLFVGRRDVLGSPAVIVQAIVRLQDSGKLAWITYDKSGAPLGIVDQDGNQAVFELSTDGSRSVTFISRDGRVQVSAPFALPNSQSSSLVTGNNGAPPVSLTLAASVVKASACETISTLAGALCPSNQAAATALLVACLRIPAPTLFKIECEGLVAVFIAACKIVAIGNPGSDQLPPGAPGPSVCDENSDRQPPPPPPPCVARVGLMDLYDPNTPNVLSVAAEARSLAFSVVPQGSGGCGWTAASLAPWMTIKGSGSGNSFGGILLVDVSENSGNARTGTLVVAGQAITVNQAACTGAGDVACPIIAVSCLDSPKQLCGIDIVTGFSALFVNDPGLAPISQSIRVTNAGSGLLSGLSIEVYYSQGVPHWLDASLDANRAPATIVLRPVSPLVLPPLTAYSALVIVRSTPAVKKSPTYISTAIISPNAPSAIALQNGVPVQATSGPPLCTFASVACRYYSIVVPANATELTTSVMGGMGGSIQVHAISRYSGIPWAPSCSAGLVSPGTASCTIRELVAGTYIINFQADFPALGSGESFLLTAQFR